MKVLSKNNKVLLADGCKCCNYYTKRGNKLTKADFNKLQIE